MGLIDDDKLIEKSYEISKSGKMTNTGYDIV